VTITSDNPDLGEVREELEAEFNAEPIAIGFNPKYVVELLTQMSCDQITIAYMNRRRRLPTSRMTRNTTCTGCRAASSGRTRCGELARLPFAFRPAPLRFPPRDFHSGSCSGSELPRRFLPLLDPRLRMPDL
jgi:hypothetical protein